MAFNPFNFFRRNQKAILAALAILCMFVFILSFGAGDFFTWAQSKFGGGPRDKTPVVATLYGRPVHEGDLNRVQSNRQLASEFLAYTARQQQLLLGQRARSLEALVTIDTRSMAVTATKVPGPLGQAIKQVVGNLLARENRTGQPLSPQVQQQYELAIRADLDLLRNAMLLDRSSDGKTSAYDALDSTQRGPVDDLVQNLQYELYRTAAGSNATDQLEGLTGVVFDQQEFKPHVVVRSPALNRTFFLGGARTTEELLDFLVWKEQADKLGIHPTDSAVLRLALVYAGAKTIPVNPSFESDPTVRTFLAARRESGQMLPEYLAEALRDEVRVALAREALTGRLPAGTFPAVALSLLPTVPAQASPGEGYAEFQRLATTANMALLEVPVSSFLDKVTGQPTEEQLQALFDKYKNDEPRPDRDRPAFKEPRRAKVQYLHVTGTSPFMLAQADKARRFGEAAKPVGVALAAGLAHGGIASHPFTVPALVAALQPDSLLTEDHESYKLAPRNQLASWLEDDYFNFRGAEFEKYGMHDSSWMRPGPTAPLVAHLLGASLGGGTPLNAASDWAANVYRFESGDRGYYQKRIATALGPSFLPNGDLVSGLALVALRKAGELPEPVAMQTLAPMYRQARVESLARNIRGGLMREAFEKLKALRGKTEKEAAPLLEAFLKEREIEDALHGTPYAMDQFDLAKTPTIAGIAQLTGQFGAAAATDLAVRLALNGRGTFDPLRFSSRFNAHFQDARGQSQAAREEDAWSRALSDPQAMIIWRAEDREAMVPATLDTFVWERGERVKVRDKVLAAWKWQRAQDLARDYAKGIRAELLALRGKQEVSATAQWLRERKVGDKALVVKELKNRGRLVKEPSPILTDPTYVAGDIPADVIAMPQADTLDQLLSAFKARGDAAVVRDRPASHWYVALAEEIDVPKEVDYVSALNAVKTLILSGQSGSLANGFYAAHLTPLNERSYDEKLLSRMRLEACKDQDRVDADGRWLVPAALRTNYDRSETGE